MRLSRPMRFRTKCAVGLTSVLVAYNVFVYVYNRSTPFTLGVWIPVNMIANEWVATEERDHKNEEKYWLQVLDSAPTTSLNLPDLGDRNVLNGGNRLPDSFFFSGDSCPISSMNRTESLLFDGTIIVRNNREYYSFLRFNAALTVLVQQLSPELISWLAKRSDNLPPTRLDSLIYYSMGEYNWPGADKSFWLTTGGFWRRMSQGRNPIYRLIALRTAYFWVDSVDEMYDVCERGLNEPHSVFQFCALLNIRILASASSSGIMQKSAFAPAHGAEIDTMDKRFLSVVEKFSARPHPNHNDGTLEWCDVQEQAQTTVDLLKKTNHDQREIQGHP